MDGLFWHVFSASTSRVNLIFVTLRAGDFPSSLYGKGHDTGVVCKWLEHVLNGMDSWQTSFLKIVVQDSTDPSVDIMRYTIYRANMFFHVLYRCGVFLPYESALMAQSACFDLCVPRLLCPSRADLRKATLSSQLEHTNLAESSSG